MIDIDSLAQPISDDNPAGDNTEYTELPALERLATGTQDSVDPTTQEVTPGEEPDWRAVGKSATQLLGNSKDLRAACLLTGSELALRGYVGLGQGLQLVARLLEDFWATVHPQLDETDDNDSTERRNALAYLNAPMGLVNALRKAPMVESRAIGRYTARDLDMVLGRMAVPEGTSAPTSELLSAAWQAGDEQANAARAQAVDDALEAIGRIEAKFRDEIPQHPSPDFDQLKQTLKRVKEFFARQANDADSVQNQTALEPEDGIEEAPAAAGHPIAGARVAGAQSLASRADAVRILKQVSEFLRKNEPSSPAPIFVDRAVRLLQMDFAAIVKELMPESKDRIELLGGVSLDSPEE